MWSRAKITARREAAESSTATRRVRFSEHRCEARFDEGEEEGGDVGDDDVDGDDVDITMTVLVEFRRLL